MADLVLDQPTLDLWSIENVHQVGHIRLPWDGSQGLRAGDLIPAWRCCRCGGVELNRIFWEWSHGCCGEHPRIQPCPEPGGPYDMTPHWVAPDQATVTSGSQPPGGTE